jgi:hypothetical protein
MEATKLYNIEDCSYCENCNATLAPDSEVYIICSDDYEIEDYAPFAFIFCSETCYEVWARDEYHSQHNTRLDGNLWSN